MRKLTLKQRRFTKEYLRTGNGTQAALAVYETRSPNVARSMASENLAKPNVRDEVQEALRKSGLEVGNISAELASIGFKEAERPLSYTEKLKALELALKISGKLDKSSTRLTVSLSQRLEGVPFQELQKKLAQSNTSSSELLQDLDRK